MAGSQSTCLSVSVCLCLCMCVCLLLGYMSMTDNWFSEYVLEVVVDKKFIPATMLDVLSQEPKVLPAWDPMGALAQRHCACCHDEMSASQL